MNHKLNVPENCRAKLAGSVFVITRIFDRNKHNINTPFDIYSRVDSKDYFFGTAKLVYVSKFHLHELSDPLSLLSSEKYKSEFFSDLVGYCKNLKQLPETTEFAHLIFSWSKCNFNVCISFEPIF